MKEDHTDPMTYLKNNNLTFTGALGGMDSLEAYGVSPIPHTFFIDKQGNVVDNVVGSMDAAEFEKRVTHLISL